MKSYDRFSEDIEQRRVALAQRQRETLARSKEKGAQVSSDASASFAAQKEKNDAANQLLQRKRESGKQREKHKEIQLKQQRMKQRQKEI